MEKAANGEERNDFEMIQIKQEPLTNDEIIDKEMEQFMALEADEMEEEASGDQLISAVIKKQRISVDDYKTLKRPTPPVVVTYINQATSAAETQSSPASSHNTVYARPLTTNLRDPRGRSSLPIEPTLPMINRNLFLEGAISARELIQKTPVQEDLQSEHGNSRERSGKKTKLEMSLESIRASITKSSMASPLVSGKQNLPLLSLSSEANVRKSVPGHRSSNFANSVQQVVNQMNVSNSVRPSVAQQIPSPGSSPAPSLPEPKNVQHKSVQTTVNDGFFSMIIDLKTLTKKQREALKEFKKAMEYSDEGTTSGILERLKHRRANAICQQNGSQTTEVGRSDRPTQTPSPPIFSAASYSSIGLDRDEPNYQAGPSGFGRQPPSYYDRNRRSTSIGFSASRECESQMYVNPSAPPKNKSKYASNAIPM